MVEVHDHSGNAENSEPSKPIRFKTSMLRSDLYDFSILKINITLIDNAEDLDIVMLMYNLLQYWKNYSKTTGSFWNYYRDEPNSGSGGEDKNKLFNQRFKIFLLQNKYYRKIRR